MRARVIRIGNSQRIRIPKTVLQACHLERAVELEVRKGPLVVSSVTPRRVGWEEAFRRMAVQGDDALLDRRTWPQTQWVRLDPREGREIQKTRPCLIISPDEMNRPIGTVIIAPMTTQGRDYPTRVPLRFRRRIGQIVLDQIRTVDKGRLVKFARRIDALSARKVLAVLGEMFAL